MSPYRRRRRAGLLLCVLCVTVAEIVRVLVIAGWGVWTPDGRLAVNPLLYAASQGIDLLVASGLFLWVTIGINGNGGSNGRP